MSLDGIVLNNICMELKNTLIGCKVDKVYQPEKDEIHLNIRTLGSNLRLLISASSNNPRVYFTKFTKDNPQNPPMFCMLLRKHIQGGRVVDVEQVSLERILKISIESMNEMGDMTVKELVIEIMGKHSNIVLIDKSSEKIIDSIKRVPISISSVRQVLPGLIYSAPPSQDKAYPINIEKDEFLNFLNNSENLPVFKFLYQTFIGLSPLIAREICFLSNIDSDIKLSSLSEETKANLFKIFKDLYLNVKNGDYTPTVVKDENDYDIVAFSSINLNQFGSLPKVNFESISELLDYYYLTRDKVDRIKQKSNDLRKSITIKLDRALNKLSKQEREISDAEKRDIFKIYGELITANIYQLKEGLEEVELDNFYSENYEKIKIKLSKNLTPSENAQKYFKKYNKLKTAYSIVSKELVKTKEEISYLEHILLALETSTEVEELDEIREELIKEGYLKRSNSKKSKKQTKSTSQPHHYKSSDGFDIYVGKNNNQNDYLTLRFASKEDIWLHTKVIPGSHVIIKSEGRDVPENTILEAAYLAGFYSKGKMSSNVPIDYTERKNVKKPNGAKPGMVIYDTNNTVYITPSVENISKIEKLQ